MFIFHVNPFPLASLTPASEELLQVELSPDQGLASRHVEASLKAGDAEKQG